MRIYKYWAEHIQDLKGSYTPKPARAFGGSNISLADAQQKAVEKLELVQKIVSSANYREREAYETAYEADIVEEIIEEIDEKNIVTRNRYGVLVLNSEEVMFIDVDTFRKPFWNPGRGRAKNPKELMLKDIERAAGRARYNGWGFRIYETFKGYRIIVTNQSFPPRSKEAKRLMRAFHADYKYRQFCLQQNCYRARLTPKPHRIKQRRTRIIFPNRTDAQEKDHLAWVKDYEYRSDRYSTCRLVATIGEVATSPVIDYHDKVSRAMRDYALG